MKKLIVIISTLTATSAYAASGSLFNVTSSGSSLSITTVAPNHTYPNAGIKINTPGYTLSGAGTECSPISNGFCLFSVSNTQSKTISLNSSGTEAPLNVTLCLNGKGPLSCQSFNFPANETPRHAYVTNYLGSPIVSLCELDSNGIITTCQSSGSESDLPSTDLQGITLNNAGTMAYMTPSAGTSLYQCNITPANGTFSSCVATPITAPAGYNPEYGMITLNPANTIAYIGDADSTGRVLACPISGGLISGTCVNTGATGISNGIAGITLNRAGTTAYLADYSNSTITICSVSGSTFSSCIVKTGGSSYTFNEPGEAALNLTESIVYITDYGNNVVYGCSTTPNPTSQFDSCFIAANIPNAWGIALNKAGTIAYVADYNNTVSQCPILNNGTFGTCTLNSTFNAPVDIALGYS